MAYQKFIENIKNIQNRNPVKLTYHLDLKEGLQEGSAAKCSKNEIKQMAPQVTIKNIDIISATKFISPAKQNKKAIPMVTSEALKGSPLLFSLDK